jgi:hypothetical protein
MQACKSSLPVQDGHEDVATYEYQIYCEFEITIEKLFMGHVQGDNAGFLYVKLQYVLFCTYTS